MLYNVKKMELNSDQWKWQDGWTERQTDNPKKNLRFLGHYQEVCDIFKLIYGNLQKVTKT